MCLINISSKGLVSDSSLFSFEFYIGRGLPKTNQTLFSSNKKCFSWTRSSKGVLKKKLVFTHFLPRASIAILDLYPESLSDWPLSKKDHDLVGKNIVLGFTITIATVSATGVKAHVAY